MIEIVLNTALLAGYQDIKIVRVLPYNYRNVPLLQEKYENWLFLYCLAKMIEPMYIHFKNKTENQCLNKLGVQIASSGSAPD